jgi:hypothetical protein
MQLNYKIVITGGTGRFGSILKNIYKSDKLFFPNKNELNILHKNRKKIGFPYASLWSSTEYEGSFVWVLDSVDGRQYRTKKSEECCVRPVKSL